MVAGTSICPVVPAALCMSKWSGDHLSTPYLIRCTAQLPDTRPVVILLWLTCVCGDPTISFIIIAMEYSA